MGVSADCRGPMSRATLSSSMMIGQSSMRTGGSPASSRARSRSVKAAVSSPPVMRQWPWHRHRVAADKGALPERGSTAKTSGQIREPAFFRIRHAKARGIIHQQRYRSDRLGHLVKPAIDGICR